MSMPIGLVGGGRNGWGSIIRRGNICSRVSCFCIGIAACHCELAVSVVECFGPGRSHRLASTGRDVDLAVRDGVGVLTLPVYLAWRITGDRLRGFLRVVSAVRHCRIALRMRCCGVVMLLFGRCHNVVCCRTAAF